MTARAGRLEALLDREIEVASQLLSTLAAEKLALTGAEPAAVERYAAQKAGLFKTLEQLESERASLSPGSHRVGAAAAQWASLLDILGRCRMANELNGHIIHARQHQIRQLLHIVRGSPASGTYDTHGKTAAQAQRALARA